MQTVTIEMTLPSGNTYGFTAPNELLLRMLPFDSLDPCAPLPESVSNDDAPSYRAARAAAIFVAQQESITQMIREGRILEQADESQQTRAQEIIDTADRYANPAEFAADIASFWRHMPKLMAITREEFFISDHSSVPNVVSIGTWFQALFQETCVGGADSGARYGVEYHYLRNNGHSPEEIAAAIAEALCLKH